VDLASLTTLAAAAAGGLTDTGITDAGKAIALGVGAGLGSIGAGIGIGLIFASEIESVARQPEMRNELQSIRWLGFALCEAVAFYTFIFGLIAFFL
jgi:F-type H+-transporting ATPase subunit c